MKIFKLLILFILLSTISQTSAQAKKTVDPLFDSTTNCRLRYYYYPNLEAYYDSVKEIYYYTIKGEWIVASELPNGYRGYSIYNKCKIAINDYDDEDPTQFIARHKKQFPYAPTGKIKNMMALAD